MTQRLCRQIIFKVSLLLRRRVIRTTMRCVSRRRSFTLGQSGSPRPRQLSYAPSADMDNNAANFLIHQSLKDRRRDTHRIVIAGHVAMERQRHLRKYYVLGSVEYCSPLSTGAACAAVKRSQQGHGGEGGDSGEGTELAHGKSLSEADVRSVDGWGRTPRVSHAQRCATMIRSPVRLNAPSGRPSPDKGTP